MIRRWYDWRDYLGNDQERAHRAWLKRGREGPGRIELSEIELRKVLTSGSTWTAARFVRCRMART